MPWAGKGQAGFTLVELLVALVIGLFLIAAIGGVYASSRGIFSATGEAISMDDNARAAFEWIGDSARQAGFGGCSGQLLNIAPGDVRGGNYANATNPNSWWLNLDQPVQGFLPTSQPDQTFPTVSAGAPSSSTDANTPPPERVANSDAFALIGVDIKNEAVVQHDDDGGTVSTITTTTPHSIQAGQILLGTDCQTNSYFVASSVSNSQSSGTVTIASGNNCSINLADSCGRSGGITVAGTTPITLQDGGLIMPVIANAYFIAPSVSAIAPTAATSTAATSTATTPANQSNSLWVLTTDGSTDGNPVPRELVRGVQNMKVEYGLDTNGDGSIDSYVPASSVTNWSQVIALKVHLLMATQPASGVRSVGSNAITFDGTTFQPPAGDNRIYREYTSVFSLRNRVS